MTMANISQIIVWERMRERKTEKNNFVRREDKDDRDRWQEKNRNDKATPETWSVEKEPSQGKKAAKYSMWLWGE
jgi:hypothetical protein